MSSLAPNAPPDTTVEHIPLRLLCVAAREPDWTSLATQMSLDYCTDLRVVWVADAKSALTELRAACFDAVLLGDLGASRSASSCQTVDFIDAAQTLETAVPFVVLLAGPDDRLQAELHRRDCEVCVSPRMWDSSALAAVVAAAIRRRQRWHELQRLTVAHQRRLARDQADAASVLKLQQALLRGLACGADETRPGLSEGPASKFKTSEVFGDFGSLTRCEAGPSESPHLILCEWVERYDDLLKASILSGANRMTAAIAEFVSDLIASDAGPADVLALHIDRVRALSNGWGGRSSQHLVSRADLLVLEVLAQLGEHYRQRCEKPGLRRHTAGGLRRSTRFCQNTRSCVTTPRRRAHRRHNFSSPPTR